MSTLLVRGAGIFLALLVGSAVTLVGGFYVSRAILPHWPPDYHATAAIALFSLVLIAAAGIAANRPKKSE